MPELFTFREYYLSMNLLLKTPFGKIHSRPLYIVSYRPDGRERCDQPSVIITSSTYLELQEKQEDEHMLGFTIFRLLLMEPISFGAL